MKQNKSKEVHIWNEMAAYLHKWGGITQQLTVKYA